MPNGAQTAVPGVFAKLTGTPSEVRRWAPTLGQHNDEILGVNLGMSEEQIAAARGEKE